MRNLQKISFLFFLICVLVFTSCNTKNEVTNLTINRNTINLKLGEVDSVVVTLTITGDINKLPITYSSTNSSITVIKESTISNSKTKSSTTSTNSKTYTIAGENVGSTIITFTSGEKTFSCLVTVDDQISPQMTQGELWFYGDAYKLDISNNFTLYLGSAGINMEDLTGSGEVIFLELNTDLSITDSIPSGTYEMTVPYSNKFLPFTLVPAYVDDNNIWGTWYFGNTTNDIVSGNAVVSIENNIYKIDYTLLDYFGNTISGTFNGPVKFFDATEPTISNVKSISNTKIYRQKIKLRRNLN